jgi:hypothetical protein
LNSSQIIFDPDVEVIPYLVYSLGLLKEVVTNSIAEGIKGITPYPKIVMDYLTWNGPIDMYSLLCVSIFPNLFRFLITTVFIGSFILRPVAMRPVSLVWARIVESEKPVFTLIFGGAAAFASAVIELTKHL